MILYSFINHIHYDMFRPVIAAIIRHGVKSINSAYTVWTVTAKDEEWIRKEKPQLSCEGCEVGNLLRLLSMRF